MVPKPLLLLSVQTLLIKCALSQCLGRGFYGPGRVTPFGFGFGGYGYGGCGYGGFPAAGWRGGWGTGLGYGGWGMGGFGGYGPFGGFNSCLSPSSFGNSFGGCFTVTSASPIAPIGLIVTSENAIEGAVEVVGTLPFLGAVTTDGAFPSAGAGSVAYGCGDGSVGIAAETPVAAAVGPALGCGCA